MQTREGVAGYGETGAPLPAWRGRRAVLRAGFGCVLALLVFSTVEAYRIQGSVSDRHAEVYRHYLDQDGALSQLRRNILLGSTYIRDFFMSTRPERAQVYRNQIRELQSQNRHALALLDDLQTEATRGESPRSYGRGLLAHARARCPRRMEYLVALSAAYDFIQRESRPPAQPRAYTGAPAAHRVLPATTCSSRSWSLRAGTHRRPCGGLVVMLVLCVVVSDAGGVVARLRYAEIPGAGNECGSTTSRWPTPSSELQRLSARLIDMQEEERRRLSRGLHDEIGQTLTALRIEISHALVRWRNCRRCASGWSERARLAERTVQSVRDISAAAAPGAARRPRPGARAPVAPGGLRAPAAASSASFSRGERAASCCRTR